MPEPEHRACEIQLRAERKASELLRDMEKAKGGGDQKSEHRSSPLRGDRPTFRDLGISYQQSSDWQKVADVPEEQFEAALARRAQGGTSLTDFSGRDPKT